MAERDDFERFHLEVRPRLWAWLRRTCGDPGLADEIAQESFVRLIEGAGAALPADERRAYVFGIAWRVLAESRRRARRHAPLAEAPDAVVEPLGPEAARVAAALEALPERQRALLWLAHVEGWTHREIAGSLGLAEGSVKVLLHRARAAALARLGGGGDR